MNRCPDCGEPLRESRISHGASYNYRYYCENDECPVIEVEYGRKYNYETNKIMTKLKNVKREAVPIYGDEVI